MLLILFLLDVLHCSEAEYITKSKQVSFSCLPKERGGVGGGGGGGGGNYIFVCKVCGKLGGFVFGPFINAIWWNLGLFSYKHNLPFMHHYIIDLHVK